MTELDKYGSDSKRHRLFKMVLLLWIVSWIACFVGLIVYLYNGGELTIWVWVGFLLLAFISPGVSSLKELITAIEVRPR